MHWASCRRASEHTVLAPKESHNQRKHGNSLQPTDESPLFNCTLPNKKGKEPARRTSWSQGFPFWEHQCWVYLWTWNLGGIPPTVALRCSIAKDPLCRETSSPVLPPPLLGGAVWTAPVCSAGCESQGTTCQAPTQFQPLELWPLTLLSQHLQCLVSSPLTSPFLVWPQLPFGLLSWDLYEKPRPLTKQIFHPCTSGGFRLLLLLCASLTAEVSHFKSFWKEVVINKFNK